MAEYFDRFSPPTLEECEMARLLDLINAEWTSDPSSVACFDLRVVVMLATQTARGVDDQLLDPATIFERCEANIVSHSHT